jgi:hypothetical protein
MERDKQMAKNSPKQSDYEHAQLILKEASAYGLEAEVKQTATRYINKYPNLTYVEAYQYAYEDWVK